MVNCGPKKSNTDYIMAQVFKSIRILQMNVKIFNLILRLAVMLSV